MDFRARDLEWEKLVFNDRRIERFFITIEGFKKFKSLD